MQFGCTWDEFGDGLEMEFGWIWDGLVIYSSFLHMSVCFGVGMWRPWINSGKPANTSTQPVGKTPNILNNSSKIQVLEPICNGQCQSMGGSKCLRVSNPHLLQARCGRSLFANMGWVQANLALLDCAGFLDASGSHLCSKSATVLGSVL